MDGAAENVIDELGRHDVATIVARFDARSRVKMADDAVVAVDTSRTSFLKIDIGLAIQARTSRPTPARRGAGSAAALSRGSRVEPVIPAVRPDPGMGRVPLDHPTSSGSAARCWGPRRFFSSAVPASCSPSTQRVCGSTSWTCHAPKPARASRFNESNTPASIHSSRLARSVVSETWWPRIASMSTQDEPVTRRIKDPPEAQPVRPARSVTAERMGRLGRRHQRLDRREQNVHDFGLERAHDDGVLHLVVGVG